jgi:DNA-binding MarR family transcriptional regulator
MKRQLGERMLDIIPIVMRVMSAEMRRDGHVLSPSQAAILGMLSERRHTLGELAERSSVSAPTMSTSINTLEAHGMVSRLRDTVDRRVVWLDLTERGREVYAELRRQTVERIAQLLDGLSEDDLKTLVQGMTLLQNVVFSAMERDPILSKA